MLGRGSYPSRSATIAPYLALSGLVVASACTHIEMHKTSLDASSRGRVATLAVAPLQNLTGEASASPAMTAAIVNELRRRGSFKVLEIDTSSPGTTERWTASKLGKEAKADAVLVGVITSYAYSRVSRRGGATEMPTIGVDLRLVSTSGAELLWAATVDASLTQLFSDDSMPLEQLAQKLAERVADALSDIGARG